MNLPASAGDPPRRHRSFPDPMTYYHEHYLGLTRGELRVRDQSFYECLRLNRMLGLVPGPVRRAFGDPLAYYWEHYAELTRGELQKRDSSLCSRLRLAGLLEQVPRSRNVRDGDPLAYYHEHYPGMSRGELQKRDHSIYERLRRAGLLAAVPKARPRPPVPRSPSGRCLNDPSLPPGGHRSAPFHSADAITSQRRRLPPFQPLLRR